ncbi:MAG: site-specific integrase [Kordiimonadaceae bacterium]|jgi:integrase|nr:site-specific integrase [Kordiimonadaceae bacterium]MBT6033943.1 site-specific integrase [Kordiimonadaceae bacterium]
MARVRHLIQNEYGVYCFRYTLPKWYKISHPYDKRTILLSLKTKDFDLASARVQQMSMFTRLLLTKIKKHGRVIPMSKSKTINSILREYRNYIADADPNEQKAVYWGTEKFEEIIEYQHNRLGFIEHHGLLEFVNVDLEDVDELYGRAKAKEARVKEDEIAATLGEKENVVEATVPSTEEIDKEPIKLSALLESYVEEKASSITVKSLDQTKGHIEFLIGVVGDIDVSKFNESLLRKYRGELTKRKVKRRGTIVGIKNLTKNEHIESCRQLFEHAKDLHNVNLTNFFAGRKVKFVHKKQDSDKRVPFSTDDLQRMFSSEIFTLGTYKHPYQYWAPLLALYTGSRANEIAQLRTDDIVVKEGVYCISHNTDTDDKKLKTGDSRLVPIHPKLIELEFIKFVELFNQKKYRWTDNKENHLLFKGLRHDPKRGGYMKELSRWFNGEYRKKTNSFIGFKHDIGIKADEGTLKDFHSFRHTFSTAIQNAGVPDEFSYQMTGHSEGISNNEAKLAFMKL